MKISILKRIAAIESKVKKPEQTPSLIMITFDERVKQWHIAETYTNGSGKNQTFRRKDFYIDRLRDYSFQAEGNASVIMNTFASPDPDIYGNMFCFELAELRQNLKPGDTGEIRIEAIRGSDEGGITCEIVVFTM